MTRGSGKYAGRFTIHEGDVFNAQQLRAQVNGPKVTVQEGTDTFASFYMYMREAPKDRDNFFYWEGSPPPRYNNVMTWWVEPKKDGGGTIIRYGAGGEFFDDFLIEPGAGILGCNADRVFDRPVAGATVTNDANAIDDGIIYHLTL